MFMAVIGLQKIFKCVTSANKIYVNAKVQALLADAQGSLASPVSGYKVMIEWCILKSEMHGMSKFLILEND